MLAPADMELAVTDSVAGTDSVTGAGAAGEVSDAAPEFGHTVDLDVPGPFGGSVL